MGELSIEAAGMTYISSPSFTAPLRSAVIQTQAALNQAQTEVSSGAPADLGLTLGASTGGLLSLRSQIDALNGYTAGNSAAATRLSTTDTVLGSLLTAAQGVSASVITAPSAGDASDALQESAKAALQGLTAGLNTAVGNQNIFGGTNTTGASPVADYFATGSKPAAAVAASLQAVLNGKDPSTLTGTQLQGFLDDTSPNGFAASFGTGFSTASDDTLQTAIAPSQSVSTSVSANNPAFNQLAQGYAILSTFAGPPYGADVQSTAIAAAGKLIDAGIASLTQVQSGVGVAQAAIDSANTQIGAQVTLLQTNADDLDSVDTYALSSRVTTLQNQLEASYSLTARLQQLSLTNYLAAS